MGPVHILLFGRGLLKTAERLAYTSACQDERITSVVKVVYVNRLDLVNG